MGKKVKNKLNDKEEYGIELFRRNHECDVVRAIKDSSLDFKDFERLIFKVKSVPHDIGITTHISCLACGTEYNITDFDSW